MTGARCRSAVAALSALLGALAMPVVALAGTGGAGGAEIQGGGETSLGRGAGGGGLAGTGFDAWQIAVVGVVLIVGAVLLLRRSQPARK